MDEPARHAPLVPSWLANLASLSWRLVVTAALVVVLGFIAAELSTVTVALAIAVVITAVLVPATRRLRRGGRSRSSAAAIVWVAAMAVATGLLVLVALGVVPQLAGLVTQVQDGLADLEALVTSLHAPPVFAAAVGSVVDAALALVRGAASAAVLSAADLVTSLILATFLVFFLLRDGDRAWGWCLQGVGAAQRDRMTTAGEDALGRVGGYLVGTTVLSALIAVTDLVFMVLLGVPLAGLITLLVFLGGYIPYFGGIVTTLIMLLVTLTAVGPTAALAMIILIALRNAVITSVVRPTVYGRSVSLHPALILVALPAGYQLAGVVGLFVAVPVTAVALAVASAVVAVVEPDPPPVLPGLVPAWLDRIAQWSWRLLAATALVALVVVLFTALPLVLVPIVLGIILAATFSPAVDALERRGRRRGSAIGITLGTTFLVVGGMLLLAVGTLFAQGTAVAAAVVEGAGRTDDATGGALGVFRDAVAILTRSGSGTLVTLAQQATGAMTVALLSTLLCFYFLRDGRELWARTLRLARPNRVEEVRATGARAFAVLGGYMYGTAVISLAGALSQLVIMLVLGIPLAVPVFVLSFFLCFIPYIGGFISTGIAFLLTVATGDPTAIAVMAIWTVVFNLVTGNVISPIVYGRTVHLHPAVVLVAIPIGSAVAGIMGMLLVVPLLGVVAVSWRTVVHVMATDPSPAPPAEVVASVEAAPDVPPEIPPAPAPAPT